MVLFDRLLKNKVKAEILDVQAWATPPLDPFIARFRPPSDSERIINAWKEVRRREKDAQDNASSILKEIWSWQTW